MRIRDFDYYEGQNIIEIDKKLKESLVKNDAQKSWKNLKKVMESYGCKVSNPTFTDTGFLIDWILDKFKFNRSHITTKTGSYKLYFGMGTRGIAEYIAWVYGHMQTLDRETKEKKKREEIYNLLMSTDDFEELPELIKKVVTSSGGEVESLVFNPDEDIIYFRLSFNKLRYCGKCTLNGSINLSTVDKDRAKLAKDIAYTWAKAVVGDSMAPSSTSNPIVGFHEIVCVKELKLLFRSVVSAIVYVIFDFSNALAIPPK